MSDKDPEEKGPKILNAEAIEYANELIEELHPIDDTPLCVAFPWLGALTWCGVPNVPRYRKDIEAEENHKLDPETGDPLLRKKTTMMVNGKEVKKKQKKKKKNNLGNTEKFEKQPLAQLGFGIVAYIDILWTLIVTFALFTLMLYPTIHFFHSGKGYATMAEKLIQYEHGTLGNLGYSSVQCAAIPLDVGNLNIQCPFGTVGEIFDYGVNLSDEDASNCASKDSIANCRPDSSAFVAAIGASVGSDSFLYSFTFADLYTEVNTHQECVNTDDSRLFVQYSCIQSAADQHQKYNQMCMVVATGVAIAFLFTITIRYLYQGGKMQQIDWDMSTVTAGDYTVELMIDPDEYTRWRDGTFKSQDKDAGESPALGLKKHLVTEIESVLDDWIDHNPWAVKDLHKKRKAKKDKNKPKEYKPLEEKQEKYKEPTKIADIVFSFKNRDLILALRARGAKIAANDFEGMQAVNVKVQSLFDDPEEYLRLTTPTSAFITFESDDTKEYALKMETDKQVLGQALKFKDASEPTDIIWENRHFTRNQYYCRELFAFSIIVMLLGASFAVIFAISDYSANMSAVFPPVDCEGIQSSYTGDLLQKYAIDDYDFIITHEGAQSAGTLQCFCQQQKILNPETYRTDTYGQKDDVPVCGDFEDQVYSVYLWTTSLSYLLIGINYILRTVCIMLVDWIGYNTETERLQKTTSITFWVQVFNSAFLLLLINANLSEQPISFGINNGAFSDFDDGWFKSVGNVIIGAMIFNVYYPLLEAGLYFLLRWQGRCRDRGCTFSGKTTKQTSVQAYLNVYSGPVYYMHYKYSSIMTITFITFIYGFGMPLLFPIACASFIVLYLVEKWLLFYGYRLPPMYDERLSQDVLNKLSFAPVLYLCFGYWFASNQQLLQNDHLYPTQSTQDPAITGHTYGTMFTADGLDGIKWPLFFAFWFLLIIYFFSSCLEACIGHCFPNLIVGDIELNEDIDKYWASLDEGDRKWSIEEEKNNRELITTKILTDEQFDRLQATKMTKRHTLQGVHSYDILANPLYFDDFQYVTCAEEDRDQVIIDDDEDDTNDCAQSDMVRVCLNLAYCSMEEATNFKFTVDYLKGDKKKTPYQAPNTVY